MYTSNTINRLAQSSSAAGAAILGFSVGALWGDDITQTILLSALLIGALLHIAGMYVTQMKDKEKATSIAKFLWISAWICLLSLAGIFVYLLMK